MFWWFILNNEKIVWVVYLGGVGEVFNILVIGYYFVKVYMYFSYYLLINSDVKVELLLCIE